MGTVDEVTTPSGRPARGPRGTYAGTDRRREEIIGAAFDVFRRLGYQGGTMREIADAVGVSHTSLKHHFGSKEDLLIAVLRRRSEVDLPLIRAFSAEGGLLYAAIAMAHYNSRHRGIVQLHTRVVAEAADPEHPARAFEQHRYDSMLAEMSDGFEDLQRAEVLVPGLDPRVEARLLSSLGDGLQIQWMLDPTVDMPAVTATYVDRLHVGPVRRPTSSEIDDIVEAVLSRAPSRLGA